MESFKAIKSGSNKFYSHVHGEIHIHKSKKDNYEYLWSTKDKFISNLYPIDLNKYTIPKYKGNSYIVTIDDAFLNVDLVI